MLFDHSRDQSCLEYLISKYFFGGGGGGAGEYNVNWES